METRKIYFESLAQCQSFLRVSEKMNCNLDIRCGSRTVDGKSLLGILSFGLKKELELVIYEENVSKEEIQEFLKIISFYLCSKSQQIAV